MADSEIGVSSTLPRRTWGAALGDAEDAAGRLALPRGPAGPSRHILAEHDDALVAGHLLVQGLVERIAHG